MFYNGTHWSHVYESSNGICVCRVGAVSSVSIQAYVYVCICMHQCTPASACVCIHSICYVYRGDFKAKTPLKAQIHLGNAAIVMIP